MSKPIHTPGPVIARPYPESKVGRITITGRNSPVAIAEVIPTTMKGYDAKAEANGRLLAAAYNAFDSAARNLGWNAVLFAEAAQDGGIADLVDALISAERFIAKQSGGGETEFRASLLAVLRKVNPGVQA